MKNDEHCRFSHSRKDELCKLIDVPHSKLALIVPSRSANKKLVFAPSQRPDQETSRIRTSMGPDPKMDLPLTFIFLSSFYFTKREASSQGVGLSMPCLRVLFSSRFLFLSLFSLFILSILSSLVDCLLIAANWGGLPSFLSISCVLSHFHSFLPLLLASHSLSKGIIEQYTSFRLCQLPQQEQ